MLNFPGQYCQVVGVPWDDGNDETTSGFHLGPAQFPRKRLVRKGHIWRPAAVQIGFFLVIVVTAFLSNDISPLNYFSPFSVSLHLYISECLGGWKKEATASLGH